LHFRLIKAWRGREKGGSTSFGALAALMNMHEYRIIKYIYEKVIQIKMKLVRGECAESAALQRGICGQLRTEPPSTQPNSTLLKLIKAAQCVETFYVLPCVDGCIRLPSLPPDPQTAAPVPARVALPWLIIHS